MKIAQLFSTKKNKANNQGAWHPRKRIFKEMGITPEQFLNKEIPKALMTSQKNRLIPIKLKSIKMEAYR